MQLPNALDRLFAMFACHFCAAWVKSCMHGEGSSCLCMACAAGAGSASCCLSQGASHLSSSTVITEFAAEPMGKQHGDK
jgi:hypothetical protein